jgi:RNA methyltransferase, TrmH family
VLSRAEEKLIVGLHRRGPREKKGLFLVEGERVIGELLDSGLSLRLAIAAPSAEDSEGGHELLGRLAESCPLRRVDESTLARLAATESPQGVLAVAEIPRHELESWSLSGPATVVVLDAVQDPGNFGTVLRSAWAFGARLAVVLPGTVDPWNPKAVRSAAGASFRLPVAAASLDGVVSWLARNDITLVAADARGVPADGFAFGPRTALVVGNEGAGLRPEIRSAAHALLSIPMSGPAESLNVAVAAGILLYLMSRNR